MGAPVQVHMKCALSDLLGAQKRQQQPVVTEWTLTATREGVIFEPLFHSHQVSWVILAHHCLELYTK